MGDLYDKYHSYFQVFPITLIHKPIKLYCDENKNDVHSGISIDNSIQLLPKEKKSSIKCVFCVTESMEKAMVKQD